MSKGMVRVTRREIARRGPTAGVPAFIADPGDDAAAASEKFMSSLR
ncbi:MAG: hypothetical protein HY287_17255 [Planctomycetes bacterium]|nr:hypothetical protein [Planctomycetota bacterium]MBI3836075.1 hypothetical protein [Planctomycetota bacterium]